MGYRLIVAAERGVGRTQVFDFEAAVVRVGRAQGADVWLPHENVSAAHLELRRDGAEVIAVELGSTNGTWLGDERLEAQSPRVLSDGDVLDVGRAFLLEFRAASPAGAGVTGSVQTADIARKLVEDLLASGATPTAPELVGEAGAAGGRRIALPAPDGRLVFGRGEGCDVVLLDPDLSREHFEVRRTSHGATVADLGSKNGTRVQDVPVEGDVALSDGTSISAGACRFRFEDPAERYLRQLAALSAEKPSADAPAEPAPEPAPEPPGPSASRGDDRGRRVATVSLVLLGLLVTGAVGALVYLFTL